MTDINDTLTNAVTAIENLRQTVLTDTNTRNASVVTANTKASEASASAAAALAERQIVQSALASFRANWLGSFADDVAAEAYRVSNNITRVDGLQYFNTTSDKTRQWKNTAWEDYDATAEQSQTNAALSATQSAASASASQTARAAAEAAATSAQSNKTAIDSLRADLVPIHLGRFANDVDAAAFAAANGYSSADGLRYYNTTTNKFRVRVSGTWSDEILPGVSAVSASASATAAAGSAATAAAAASSASAAVETGLATTSRTVSNMSSLRGLAVTVGRAIDLLGYYLPGDEGGGQFYGAQQSTFAATTTGSGLYRTLKVSSVSTGIVYAGMQIYVSGALFGTILCSDITTDTTVNYIIQLQNSGAGNITTSQTFTGKFVDDNGIVIVPTGGDGSLAWVRVTEGIETSNVMWFGAKADGVTDDSGPANAALAKIAFSGGRAVFPAKRYMFKSQVTLDSYSIPAGSNGWRAAVISAHGAQFFTEGGVYAFDIRNGTRGRKTVFEGGLIDQRGNTTALGGIMLWNAGANPEIRDTFVLASKAVIPEYAGVTIAEGTYGAKIIGGGVGTIQGADGLFNAGVLVLTYANGTVVNNCTFGGTRGCAVITTPTVKLENASITAKAATGITGSISGTNMTVTAMSGDPLLVGAVLTGDSITAGTEIASVVTPYVAGVTNGVYTVTTSQTRTLTGATSAFYGLLSTTSNSFTSSKYYNNIVSGFYQGWYVASTNYITGYNTNTPIAGLSKIQSGPYGSGPYTYVVNKVQYRFDVTATTTAPAIGSTFVNNGVTFTVIGTTWSGSGTGSIWASGVGAPTASGTTTGTSIFTFTSVSPTVNTTTLYAAINYVPNAVSVDENLFEASASESSAVKVYKDIPGDVYTAGLLVVTKNRAENMLALVSAEGSAYQTGIGSDWRIDQNKLISSVSHSFRNATATPAGQQLIVVQGDAATTNMMGLLGIELEGRGASLYPAIIDNSPKITPSTFTGYIADEYNSAKAGNVLFVTSGAPTLGYELSGTGISAFTKITSRENTYRFTISTAQNAPTVGSVYNNSSVAFTVKSVSWTGNGTGIIEATGFGAPAASGTLTGSPANITYASVVSLFRVNISQLAGSAGSPLTITQTTPPAITCRFPPGQGMYFRGPSFGITGNYSNAPGGDYGRLVVYGRDFTFLPAQLFLSGTATCKLSLGHLGGISASATPANNLRGSVAFVNDTAKDVIFPASLGTLVNSTIIGNDLITNLSTNLSGFNRSISGFGVDPTTYITTMNYPALTSLNLTGTITGNVLNVTAIQNFSNVPTHRFNVSTARSVPATGSSFTSNGVTFTVISVSWSGTSTGTIDAVGDGDPSASGTTGGTTVFTYSSFTRLATHRFTVSNAVAAPAVGSTFTSNGTTFTITSVSWTGTNTGTIEASGVGEPTAATVGSPQTTGGTTVFTYNAVINLALVPGAFITGSGVTSCYILAYGTGAGGVGTYIVSEYQTVASSITMNASYRKYSVLPAQNVSPRNLYSAQNNEVDANYQIELEFNDNTSLYSLANTTIAPKQATVTASINRNYSFQVDQAIAAPAIGATFVNNGVTFTVISVSWGATGTSGTGIISAHGNGVPTASGTTTGSTIFTFTASAALTTSSLIVTAASGDAVVPGAPLFGPTVPSGQYIVSQISGTTGGVGTYLLGVAVTATIASRPLYSPYGVLTSTTSIVDLNGQIIKGSGVLQGTRAISGPSGAGPYTYNVNLTQTISSPITATAGFQNAILRVANKNYAGFTIESSLPITGSVSWLLVKY